MNTQGQDVHGVPKTFKDDIDNRASVCIDGIYNRPAFVPWYDDIYPDVGSAQEKEQMANLGVTIPSPGGLWSTMAYLINRKGMAKVINKLGVGPEHMGNLSMPVLADHLLYSTAKTYTYSRPLFRAYPRESTIQPSMEADIDPTKGRVDPGDDPHTLTDGRTNQFIDKYWSGGTGLCSLTSPELKPLNLVVLATASFTQTERRIQNDNVERLGQGVESTRVVLYAINAIDNNVAGWTVAGWTQKAERLGIATMVVSAGRDKERGFESKLVSQLPLLGHIKRRVAFDYLFAIDGDISFSKADLSSLFSSVRSLRPLIAQPTIRVPADHVNGSMFTWGSQYYKTLNHEQALKCGTATEYDSPMVESQAAILSRTFLDWYHEELVQVARVQHEYQCDWGHDEMWCSGADRLSAELPDSPPACLVIRHSVDHHDSKSIQKFEKNEKGGTFLSDCQKLEQAFILDIESLKDDGKEKRIIKDHVVSGKVTQISTNALQDRISTTCINQWADLHGGGCHPPAESYSAVKSFRSFTQGKECVELQDEKAASEEAFALSKLGSLTWSSSRIDDMLSEGRGLYGSHFTPTGRRLRDVRTEIHPHNNSDPEAHWRRRLDDVMARWGPGSR